MGPLLFNILIFYLAKSTDVCNFTDDTTFLVCDEDSKTLIRSLEHDTHLAIEWFERNYMKLDQDKCRLLVSLYKHENIWTQICEVKIWESLKQKLLRFKIDRHLSFNEYISSLSLQKSLQQTPHFIKLSNLMSVQQRKLLMKSFVEAQIGYCSLVYMFHGRELNRKVTPIHEKPQRIVYKYYNSSSNIDLKSISLSVFTIETSRVCPLNYSK